MGTLRYLIHNRVENQFADGMQAHFASNPSQQLPSNFPLVKLPILLPSHVVSLKIVVSRSRGV